MFDREKLRREGMRWVLLMALNNSRPEDLVEAVIIMTIQSVYPDATQREVRRELDYLFDRKLVTIRKEPSGIWWCNLTRYGVDVAEYTVDCEPGIARPTKYWVS
ncbi:MAG: hypothetical protein C4516_04195 [Oxalobacter sp.]|jgi:hypothetical protein|nr:MAG: hypothetical protein C4516_04195 [Oxalobacter sp.]